MTKKTPRRKTRTAQTTFLHSSWSRPTGAVPWSLGLATGYPNTAYHSRSVDRL